MGTILLAIAVILLIGVTFYHNKKIRELRYSMDKVFLNYRFEHEKKVEESNKETKKIIDDFLKPKDPFTKKIKWTDEMLYGLK